MATHKSAEKRNRQAGRHRACNNAVKSSVKTGIKTVLEAVGVKNPEEAKAALTRVVPMIARAASKGSFHKKTGARKISRLTKRVNALKP